MAGLRSSASSTSRTHKTATSIAKSTAKVAIWLVLLLSLLEATTAQNIHFSNGWYPGKKRASSPVAVPMAAAAGTVAGAEGFSACSVRSDLSEIIHKLIMDEIIRIHNTCSYGMARGLRDLLESTASKVDKW